MRTPRYSAWFDEDDMPLAFIQTHYPYITVQRIGTELGWTEHRTLQGAITCANRDRTSAYSFNGIHGRWDKE